MGVAQIRRIGALAHPRRGRARGLRLASDARPCRAAAPRLIDCETPIKIAG